MQWEENSYLMMRNESQTKTIGQEVARQGDDISVSGERQWQRRLEEEDSYLLMKQSSNLRESGQVKECSNLHIFWGVRGGN
jgi:hypothetical protein